MFGPFLCNVIIDIYVYMPSILLSFLKVMGIFTLSFSSFLLFKQFLVFSVFLAFIVSEVKLSVMLWLFLYIMYCSLATFLFLLCLWLFTAVLLCMWEWFLNIPFVVRWDFYLCKSVFSTKFGTFLHYFFNILFVHFFIFFWYSTYIYVGPLSIVQQVSWGTVQFP